MPTKPQRILHEQVSEAHTKPVLLPYSQDPVVFTTENEHNDVAQIFVNSFIQNFKDIYQQFKFPKRMIFTKDDAEICCGYYVPHMRT